MPNVEHGRFVIDVMDDPDTPDGFVVTVYEADKQLFEFVVGDGRLRTDFGFSADRVPLERPTCGHAWCDRPEHAVASGV